MSPLPIDDLPWPPGFAGNLARFIYRSAPRPVKEVAVTATLGLLAGVCGRRFQISNTGLNLYIILVARSGIGKEALHSGISLLMKLGADIHLAEGFADFDDFASGPALQKAILLRPSFVNVAGEWGRKLRLMASDRDGPMQTLRTVMTNLYGKSGPNDSVGGLKYSNGENTVLGVKGAAFSFVGETTPVVFYEALTSSMMEDGFLSRFTIISYTGERPPPNDDPRFQLEPDELEHWKSILSCAVQAMTPLSRCDRIEVGYANEDAEGKLFRFGAECDVALNATDDEGRRQMLNRAHIKALRIAALLAVSDDEICPRIDLGHATWAIALVRRDIEAMSARIDSGDVGNDDHTRMDLLRAAMRDYFSRDFVGQYNVAPGMREAGIVTYSFFQGRLRQKPAFSGHPLGSIKALDIALQGLIDAGYLAKVDPHKTKNDFEFGGRCFRLMAKP